MLINMLADRFEAGGVLRAKGTQVDVATELALRWIGDGVASAVGTSRETAQGIRKDVPVLQDRVSGQQSAGDAPVSGAGNVFGVVGQSNESGRVLHTDRAAYPRCFESLRYPGVRAPLPGINAMSSQSSSGIETAYGGWHFKVLDDLYDAGFVGQIAIGAIGSSSIVRHWCGGPQSRSNSTKYSVRRAPSGDLDDYGFAGHTTVQGGKVFLATTGNNSYASNRVPYRANSPATLSSSSASASMDYLTDSGALTTAGADPGGWSGIAAGSTLTDGGIVWTNVDDTNSVGFANDAPLNEAQFGFGWDPLGLHIRLHTRMQAIQPARAKHILIMFGQTDAGNGVTQTNFRNAVMASARYWLKRGYRVHLGLSCYTPTVTTAAYNTLSAGLSDALTLLAGDVYSSRVHAGPNLYTALGSTGVMGTGGAYLNPDNVHLNGLGALAAADVISANIIATLRAIG
jgi:hypothetical protein